MANFFIIFIGIISSIKGYKYFLEQSPSSWAATDFMINYDRGFVRRGLIGTILKPIVRNFPEVNINLVPYGFTLLSIWLIVYLICRQPSLKNSFNKTAIILSPILFPLFFFNEPQGGGRKEVLALIFICFLSILNSLIPQLNKRFIYVIWSIFYPLLVLSNEATFFFLAPYLFFNIFLLEFNSKIKSGFFFCKNIFLKYIKLILPAFFTLLLSFIFKSLPYKEVQLICNSWQEIYPKLDCLNFETSFLAISSEGMYSWIPLYIYKHLDIYLQWIFVFIYISLFLSSCLIPLITPKESNISKINTFIILFFFIVIVFISNAPLYLLAADYGRWLSVSLTILIIFCLSYQNKINNISRKFLLINYMPLKFRNHLTFLPKILFKNRIIPIIFSLAFIFLKTPVYVPNSHKFFILNPFFENLLNSF